MPKDITEMLALQNKISKSRKKRGSSLSRTFSWFKGSKPKRIVSNGQSRSGRLGGWTGECSTIRQDVDNYDVSKGKSHFKCFLCVNFIVLSLSTSYPSVLSGPGTVWQGLRHFEKTSI